MRIFFTCLICLCLTSLGQAQPLVWHPGKSHIKAGRNIFILEDKKGVLTIEEVSQPMKETLFRPSGKEVLEFGFAKSVFWLRFSLENTTTDSLWLELSQAFIPHADLFFRDKAGQWQSLKAGYKVPHVQKAIKSHFQVFPLNNYSGTFYLRILPYMHPITIKIWNSGMYEVNAGRLRLFYGVYTGILLFAIVINLFLFIAFQKIYYLLYSVLVFLYMLSAAAVLEGFLIYLFPRVDLMYWYLVVPALDMPALLLYCFFFLELKKYTPSLSKILIAVSVFLFVHFVLLHFLPLLTGILLNYVYAALVFSLAIIAGIKAGKKGNRLGVYFAWAYSIWLVLLVAELSFILTGWPDHVFDISYVSVAIFVETILLALLMVRRFLWDKKEDENEKRELEKSRFALEQSRFELQADMIRMKEKFKMEMLQSQLEIQEQTMSNISQEIHDNIGQTLTLVKLNLSVLTENLTGNNKEKSAASKEMLTGVIQDLRNLARTLNTDYIKVNGLLPPVQQQLMMIEKTGIYTTSLEIEGEPAHPDPQRDMILFRIMQESLNNIVKHAGAAKITVKIIYTPDEIKVVISDNGKGFDTEEVNTDKTKGIGLQNLAKRARLINGNVVIDSKKGQGTEVVITIPEAG